MISYNTLAGSLAEDPNKLVSRQALHKAMAKDSFVKFLEQIFSDVLLSKLEVNSQKLRLKFNRIIIQDSTIIKLPKRLLSEFSGVKNGFVQVASARIQLALNLLSNHLIHFDLDSYSVNDIASKKLPIQEADLLLRDRGYFSIQEISRILKAKADFIYRYKHGLLYHDITTGKAIDLLKRLDKSKVTDIMVRLSGINGPIIRLIAMPVSIELANNRRAKLKKEAKHTPKKEVLALLSWSIFITSIGDEDISYEEVFKLYKLRWRIEIIFKAMKSHLSLDHIHNVSKPQLKFIVLIKIVMLMLIVQFIYEPLRKSVNQFYNKNISLLKLSKFLMDNKNILDELIALASSKKVRDCIHLKLIAKYCSYEKRRKRLNFTEQFEGVNA